ncbi:MAG: Asp-tRNA(Asn)/Glu-tRNA(Gln) amidotransferase subunit GatC [Patescibacteria group bacterium]
MNLDNIEKLAKLSRIELSEEEKKSFLNDFKSILDYIGQIKEVITEEPPKEVGVLHNVMREDKIDENQLSSKEEILNNVPDRSGDYIKVQQIF